MIEKQDPHIDHNLLKKCMSEIIEEFWEDNWKRIYPKGSPRPMYNSANFAPFSKWLSQQISRSTQRPSNGKQKNAKGKGVR